MEPSLSLDHTVVTCGGENDHKHTEPDDSRTKLTKVLVIWLVIQKSLINKVFLNKAP